MNSNDNVLKWFTITLENYNGDCKNARVLATNVSHAFGVAMVKFPKWTCVEAILDNGLGEN